MIKTCHLLKNTFKKITKNRNLPEEILKKWKLIAGDLHDYTIPIKIAYQNARRNLILAASPEHSLEINYNIEAITYKINSYLGKGFITGIKTIQMNFLMQTHSKKKACIKSDDPNSLKIIVSIKDEKLKSSLTSFYDMYKKQ